MVKITSSAVTGYAIRPASGWIEVVLDETALLVPFHALGEQPVKGEGFVL
jgi:hypothetical protein